MKLLILNGPNLNMTGKRNLQIYGSDSLANINASIRVYCNSRGVKCAFRQSNYEGALIDTLQKASKTFNAVLLNAGALTHYSYALRDAIECCPIPVGEVHMSDILSREPFRANDVLEEVCVFRSMGLGRQSYIEAIDRMLELLSKR